MSAIPGSDGIIRAGTSATARALTTNEFQLGWDTNGFFSTFEWLGSSGVPARSLIDPGSYHGFGFASANSYQLTNMQFSFRQQGLGMRVVQRKTDTGDACAWIVENKGRWATFTLDSTSIDWSKMTLDPAVQIRSTDSAAAGPSGMNNHCQQIWAGSDLAYGWVTNDPRIQYAQSGGYGAWIRRGQGADRLTEGSQIKLALYVCQSGSALARIREILRTEFGVGLNDQTNFAMQEDHTWFCTDIHSENGGNFTFSASQVQNMILMARALRCRRIMLYNYLWWNGRTVCSNVAAAIQLLKNAGFTVALHCFGSTWRKTAYPDSMGYSDQMTVSYNYATPVYRYLFSRDSSLITALERRRNNDIYLAYLTAGADGGIYFDENDGEDRDNSIVAATTYEWLFGTKRHFDMLARSPGMPIIGASGEHGMAYYLQAFNGSFDYSAGTPVNTYVDQIIAQYQAYGRFTGAKPDFGWWPVQGQPGGVGTEFRSQSELTYLIDAIQTYGGMANFLGSTSEVMGLASAINLGALDALYANDELPTLPGRLRRRSKGRRR